VAGTLGEAGNASPAFDVINLIRLPLYIRDLIFLGHLDGRFFRLARYGGGAVLAIYGYLFVVGVSIATLLWRYRWAEG
jgi:hypothetical protein